MTLLAFDPGKTCGWAVFSSVNGIEYGRGIIPIDEIYPMVSISEYDGQLWFNPPGWGGANEYPIDRIVCENYVGRPGQKNGGQLFWGSEAIGRLEMLAILSNTPFVRQRAVDVIGSKKNPGPAVLQSGYVQTAIHLPDQDSAYLHGFYDLVKRGVLRAKPLDP